MYRLFLVRSRLLSGQLLGRAARSVESMLAVYNVYLLFQLFPVFVLDSDCLSCWSFLTCCFSVSFLPSLRV